MRSVDKGDATSQILAVVIVVVVLAVVLSPVAVLRHRGQARWDTCQRNMWYCAKALYIYAENDYDDCLPSSACVTGSKKWNRKDFLTCATQIGEPPPIPGARPKTWPQILYSHMMNKDVMFCPEDPVGRNAPDAQVSYWWKVAVDKAWYGQGCSKQYRKENDYAYNADCIILYEHMGWHFGQTDGLKNGAQINCVFLDSHVKTHTIANATSGDPVNCAANADGEPMYFNFDTTRKQAPGNPPDASVPATYVDPGRYFDKLP
ncbi:MAG: hypothetical protein A2Z18_10880 [Armatimonadetes bacterium RBG_16_58_9]|nr:MAG: hypothetical protein A2Z18_10880 [Armatimonadetes bacterium RBG_16_58_9]